MYIYAYILYKSIYAYMGAILGTDKTMVRTQFKKTIEGRGVVLTNHQSFDGGGGMIRTVNADI
jgi:hypothetical protein